MGARIFVPLEQLGGDSVTLTGPAHRHLVRVLRARVGDAIGVFDGAGGEIDATVVQVGARALTLRLGERRRVSVAGARITLLQVVPRPDRMDWIVEKATELGVSAIVPVLTDRSPVPARAASGAAAGTAARLARWRKIASEAARQCGRAHVPMVSEPAALESALRDLEAGAGAIRPPEATAATPPCRLVLWETGVWPPLHTQVRPDAREVALAIGPEGGLSEAQVTLLRRHGFQPASLGPRILRCETAALTAIALVAAATGGLGTPTDGEAGADDPAARAAKLEPAARTRQE